MKIKIVVVSVILSNLLLINSYGSDGKEVYDFNITFENKEVNQVIVHWDAIKDAKGYFVEVREEDKMPTKTKIWEKLLENNFPGPYEWIDYYIKGNKKELKAYRQIFNRAEIVFVQDNKVTLFNCKKQRYFVNIKSVSEYPLSDVNKCGLWYIDKCSKVVSFIPEKISFTFFRKLKIEPNLIKDITLDELANNVQGYNGIIIKTKGIFGGWGSSPGERLLISEEDDDYGYYIGNNKFYISFGNVRLPAVGFVIIGAYIESREDYENALIKTYPEYKEYSRLIHRAVVEIIGRVTYKDDLPLNIKKTYFSKPTVREKGLFKSYYIQVK